jgi:CheY-like chemotaxis protein
MKVLIVDDEIAVHELLQCVLPLEGYEVVRAYNGMEACRVLEGQHVDVMLTDIHMPVMSGFELIEYVQSHLPAIAIVVMDSYPGCFSERESTVNVDAIVPKPFDINDIRQALSALEIGERRRITA